MSCLYRIAQESLQNIAKHSRAKQVSVSLVFVDGTAILTVADDGVGFDPQAMQGRGGLGLIGMQERANLVKGTLSVIAHNGEGTRVRLQVPVAVHTP